MAEESRHRQADLSQTDLSQAGAFPRFQDGRFLDSRTQDGVFAALDLGTKQAAFGALPRYAQTHPINEWFSYRSPDEVLRVIRNLSLDFDKAQLGTEFGRICMLSESVSPTAAREIQSIMDSAIIDIRKVLDDGSSEGDNVVSISMLMQRLI